MVNEPSVLEPLKVYCIRAQVKFCFKTIVRKAILLFPSLHDKTLKKKEGFAVKSVVVSTSIKQATCTKQACIHFPKKENS